MLEYGKAARLAFRSAVLLALCGCGGNEATSDADVTSDAGEPQGECKAIETSFQNGTHAHIEACSETDYAMSPPVFGDHYPNWAAFQAYDFPVPLGFLVHDLEHGAVVFFYDCPDGCADEVAEVAEFIDALPVDPICPVEIARRTVLVPRPALGARWAAAAWSHSLTADCFDAQLFGSFYERHVGRGRENFCGQGAVFTTNPCE